MNLNFKLDKFEIFLTIFSITYILFVIFAILSVMSEVNYKKSENETVKIVKYKIDGEFLENFLDEDEILFKNEEKNIFFIDGNPEEITNISSVRKACSVESAGKM